MRALLLRLAIVLSVFMAGLHAPEAAHAQVTSEFGQHHDHHDVQSAPDGQDEGGGPQDVGSEALHHHHCPAGLAAGNHDSGLAVAVAGERPHPAESASMSSRATAPPLDPPLA